MLSIFKLQISGEKLLLSHYETPILLADETTFSRHLFLENLINCEAKLVVHR